MLRLYIKTNKLKKGRKMKPVVESNLNHNMEDDIVFVNGGVELLRLNANGDIFIKGKLVAHDIDVVNGFNGLLMELRNK
jgi:hypothetical protein